MDLTDIDTWTDLNKIWIKQKMNPGPETGLKTRTKYDVYKDKARTWLNSLKPRSIGTWQEMQGEFLKKFFSTHKANALKR